MTTLRLILGDQLNAEHSWYQQRDAQVIYLLAELKQETNYVRHHAQKVCAFFAAMEQFAKALRIAGHQVLHLTLDDSAQDADLPALLRRMLAEVKATRFAYQRPDEYRLQQQLQQFCQQLQQQGIDSEQADSEHFILPFAQIPRHFNTGKSHLMEPFYRRMRQTTGILMHQGQPEGGQWNYDHDNRHKLKAADIKQLPQPLCFANPISDIRQRLQRHQVNTLGVVDDELLWPINRHQARELLHYFVRYLLPHFGQFQDAMTANSPQGWSLYHSRLSFALNSKMLRPMEVLQLAQQAYYHGHAPLNAVEGFIRQILGWREFVRGLYWANMPHYAQLNYFAATRALPSYFWHGHTKMACMAHSIQQSLKYAYAHHIQRLMVTGNFCLLAGIAPQQVDDWYLGIYIDAIEWVELPNTRGMSQFADGGLIASKPYSASGSYINKMSDYCGQCHYQVKERSSANACPFNSLYWHFMLRHRPVLANNPRLTMVYRNWDRLDAAEQQATLQRAELLLNQLEQL